MDLYAGTSLKAINAIFKHECETGRVSESIGSEGTSLLGTRKLSETEIGEFLEQVTLNHTHTLEPLVTKITNMQNQVDGVKKAVDLARLTMETLSDRLNAGVGEFVKVHQKLEENEQLYTPTSRHLKVHMQPWVSSSHLLMKWWILFLRSSTA